MTTAKKATILALNSGSSSLKFGLYHVGSSGAEALLSGEAEAIGGAKAALHARDARGDAIVSDAGPIPSQQEAIARIAALISDQALPAPAAIGHRVVHGGPKLRRHCLIDAAVMAELDPRGHSFRARALRWDAERRLFRHRLPCAHASRRPRIADRAAIAGRGR
jgi:acetate kinase